MAGRAQMKIKMKSRPSIPMKTKMKLLPEYVLAKTAATDSFSYW